MSIDRHSKIRQNIKPVFLNDMILRYSKKVIPYFSFKLLCISSYDSMISMYVN